MTSRSQSAAHSGTAIPPSDLSIELLDGRKLCYAEYGDRDGTPVLFFHGTPGSRTCVPDLQAVSATDTYLITVDRPGYGRSTPNPGRTLTDWSDDVEQLADALGIEQFSVAGLSGGGPHALVCGANLPDRVTSIGVISGMAPLKAPGVTDGMSLYTKLGFSIARYVPFLLPMALRSMALRSQNDPEMVIEDVRDSYASPDQNVLDDPEIRIDMARELTEAYDRGVQGHVDDLKALAQSWDFDLSEITVPVRLWHGGEDQNAPLAMAEYLTEALPQRHLTIFPEEGHFIAYKHFEEILNELGGKNSSGRIR